MSSGEAELTATSGCAISQCLTHQTLILSREFPVDREAQIVCDLTEQVKPLSGLIVIVRTETCYFYHWSR